MPITMSWGSHPSPVVSSVNATADSPTDATITWTVGPASTGQVLWDTSSGSVEGDYPNSSTLETNYLSFHSQTITGLSPGTIYYRIKSTSSQGVTALSAEFTLAAASSPSTFDSGYTYTDHTVTTGAGWTDGTDARANIQAFLDAIPSGSSTTSHRRIIFPAGFTWTIGYGLNVTGKSHWTIEGQGTETTYGHTGGAVVKTTGSASNTSWSGISSVWTMRNPTPLTRSGQDIRWHAMTAEGTATAYATTNAGNGGQYQGGWWIGGGEDIVLANVIGDKLQGDPVYLTDSYNGGSTNASNVYYSRNITIRNSTFKRNGRMLMSLIHVRNVTVEDCEFSDSAYQMIDLEPDWTYQNCADVAFRRCLFSGRSSWDPSSTPGPPMMHTRIVGNPGTYTRSGTWEISDCTFSSINNTNTTEAVIHLYLGPIIGGTLLITGNTCTDPRSGERIIFRNFTGGATVTNNTGFGVGQTQNGVLVHNYGNSGTVTISGNT